MTPDERIDEYIAAHTTPGHESLARIERRVNLRSSYPRMCSGHVQGRVLAMLSAMIAPRKVLEIGTFAGYSALCLAEGMPDDDCRLHTIEIDDEMESFIRENLSSSPYGSRVTLHIGDAADILPRLAAEAPFDLAFIDGNKRTYRETFYQVLPLIRPGGFILADNTLWSGKVVAEPPASDPQTLGILDFNDAVAADPRLETVILPLRDGLTLVRVKP